MVSASLRQAAEKVCSPAEIDAALISANASVMLTCIALSHVAADQAPEFFKSIRSDEGEEDAIIRKIASSRIFHKVLDACKLRVQLASFLLSECERLKLKSEAAELGEVSAMYVTSASLLFDETGKFRLALAKRVRSTRCLTDLLSPQNVSKIRIADLEELLRTISVDYMLDNYLTSQLAKLLIDACDIAIQAGRAQAVADARKKYADAYAILNPAV